MTPGRIVDRFGRPVSRAALSPGYRGAGTGRRLRNLQAGDSGPNALIAGEGATLRARSRHFTRNSPHAAAAQRAYWTDAVGVGMKPRSLHPDQGRAQELQNLWELWVREADALGAVDFYGLQQMAAAAEFDGGEVLIRRRRRRRGDGMTVPLQLQLLEADMLPHYAAAAAAGGMPPRNKVIAGVEVDALGRPAAYHLHAEHPRDRVGLFWSARAADLRRVPAEDVLHVYLPPRPGALRGVPMSAPLIERLWQLMVADTNELDKMGLAASISGVVTPEAYDADVSPGPLIPEDADGGATAPEADGTAELSLGPNEILVLGAGEQWSHVKTDYPGDGYAKFHDKQVHDLSAGWGVPFERITNDLRGVNFSSIRAGLIAYYRSMRCVQQRFAFQFYSKAWAWFVEEAFAAGVLRDARYPANKADYLAAAWRPDGFDWVDPQKEANAVISLYHARLLSWEQAVEQMGGDPRETERLIAEEERRGLAPRESAGVASSPAEEEGGGERDTEGESRAADPLTAELLMSGAEVLQ